MKNLDNILKALENETNEKLLRAKTVLQFVSLREQKGLTQQDIADRMGTTKQLISRFERMEHSPTLSFIAKYAEVLETNIDTILSNKNIIEITDEDTISDIVKYENGEISIDVNFDYDNETLWLSQKQIAQLYDVSVDNIGLHVKNILEQNELDLSTTEEFSVVQKEGNRNIKRKIKHYNLDMIVSIGYRVNSKRGIEFRKWASSIIKEYMYKGYALNQKRLDALNKTIEIQNRMLASTINVDVVELKSVIKEYTNALNILDDYDHQIINKINEKDVIYKLTYDECRKLIDTMRFTKESPLFGVEKEQGKLNGILEAVYQNVFGEDLYKGLENKAAHLLYFLVKDHPFVDGCKRIAATVFLEFLNKNGILYKNGSYTLSNDALACVTLLTAESKPEEMDLIINVIMNILSTK